MDTKITIEIELKDDETLKLDYNDGKKLFNELKKIYEKEIYYTPIVYPVIINEPIKPLYPWYTITCSNSSVK